METTALAIIPATGRGRQPAIVHPLPSPRLEAALRQACHPATLAPEALHALAAEALEERVRAGETVFTREEAAADLWLVLEGRVALGAYGGSGELQQRRSVEAGGWLDLSSAFLHGAHLEDAQAQTDARLCRLPLQAVLRCARQHAGVMPGLAAAMAAERAALVDATRGLMTKDVLERCATWLLGHAQRDEVADGGPRTGLVQLQQRKRAVAQELGTTAETFSRTLAQLSRMKLIEVRGYTIALLDLDALEKLARRA